MADAKMQIDGWRTDVLGRRHLTEGRTSHHRDHTNVWHAWARCIWPSPLPGPSGSVGEAGNGIKKGQRV